MLQLQITEDSLHIKLNLLEKILSVHGSIQVRLSDVAGASTSLPAQTWKEVRMPGTFFPGLVKAGTYYSSRGKEFWCFIRGKKPLVIELDNNSFKRLVFGIDQNDVWYQRLRKHS